MKATQLLSQPFAQRLTSRARASLKASLIVAARYPEKGGGYFVTTNHLIYALAEQEGSLAHNALVMNNLGKEQLLAYLQKGDGPLTRKIPESHLVIAPSYKRVLKKAASRAMQHNQHYIGTEHLLFGILEKAEDTNAISAARARKMKKYLHELILSTASFETLANPKAQKELRDSLQGDRDPRSGPSHHENHEMEDVHRSSRIATKTHKTSILENFCEDLSEAAQNGDLDPMVGRDDEVQRMIRVLSRRLKNNPLLVGEPGVGKTALVNGLAQKIEAADVPTVLLNKKIFSLNLNALIAGTMFRGEFEERIRDLVEEASQDDIILFIDEVHTIVGAGSAQGSLDAANIIKPALANGSFQCIGATTHEEYSRHIEKDGALDRRFQKIIIREEKPEQSVQTLKQLRPAYEAHHGVAIADNIIKLCVDLATTYLPDRALPDKALDVLDEAASKIKTDRVSNETTRHAQTLEKQLARVTAEKEDALSREHYNKALAMKQKQDVLLGALSKIQNKRPTENTRLSVTKNAVYAVISEMTGVPVTVLTKHEKTSLAQLENALAQRVLGQDEAIARVAQALKRNRTGVRSQGRPIASFLFMGPSGVGKTELAKVLAEQFGGAGTQTDTAAPLIRLDMSEFSEAHTIARLIGAPPGYVGYEESGFLTDRIKRMPYAVVLFDEIEKAHPRIFNLLLQIMEDGALTDSRGKTASFKNAIVVMTSNIGTDRIQNASPLGFSSDTSENQRKQIAASALKDILRPEIINRIDHIVVFNALDKKTLKSIAAGQLTALKQRLAETITVTARPTLATWVAQRAEGKDAGARGIRKVIEEDIEERIAEHILAGKKRVTLGVQNGKLSVVAK